MPASRTVVKYVPDAAVDAARKPYKSKFLKEGAAMSQAQMGEHIFGTVAEQVARAVPDMPASAMERAFLYATSTSATLDEIEKEVNTKEAVIKTGRRLLRAARKRPAAAAAKKLVMVKRSKPSKKR